MSSPKLSSPKLSLLLLSLPMLAAAALWGATGGIVSGLSVSGATAAAAVELMTGVALLSLGALRGQRPQTVFKVLGLRRVLLLGAIEAVNVLLYYLALQLAPVGPAMALHLMAPVLLVAVGFLRRSVNLNPRTVSSITLAGVALLLISLGGQDDNDHPHILVGLLLSLSSAACLAAFITLVRAAANDVPPMSAAGAQMLVSGLLLSPALFELSNHLYAGITLMTISLLLFAPACWLYWVAMRRLSPITASTVLLAEPIFGTAVAFMIYGQRPSILQALAALLVVGATYLSLGRGPTSQQLAKPPQTQRRSTQRTRRTPYPASATRPSTGR